MGDLIHNERIKLRLPFFIMAMSHPQWAASSFHACSPSNPTKRCWWGVSPRSGAHCVRAELPALNGRPFDTCHTAHVRMELRGAAKRLRAGDKSLFEDILSDGSLDYPQDVPQDVLARFDFIVASAHLTCGTPGYVAPELFAGGKAGQRSDIFSFGVTLWQLAARSLSSPYGVSVREDVAEYQRAVLEKAMLHRVRRIDSPLFEVIRCCLDPDPTQRYPNFNGAGSDQERAQGREDSRDRHHRGSRISR
jgi:serine/threonine protein kinase